MTAQPPSQTVVCDACVLINLLIAGQDSLLRNLKGYSFVAVTAVILEVKKEKQAKELQSWLERGLITEVPLMKDKERELMPVFSQDLDDGEAASLALACGRDWWWATDERGIAQQLSAQHLGPGRILSTARIILEGIRQELLTVPEADAIKARLEKHKFRMDFGSFGDLG